MAYALWAKNTFSLSGQVFSMIITLQTSEQIMLLFRSQEGTPLSQWNLVVTSTLQVSPA